MDLFFERLKAEHGEWPEVLEVDIFPDNVRWQCWHTWKANIEDHNVKAEIIVSILERGIGLKHLHPPSFRIRRYYLAELEGFLIEGIENASKKDNISYAFTTLELMCQQLRRNQAAISEINKRLRLGGIGYKFNNDKLFPVQDEHLHESAIIPAITLLNNPEFTEAYGYVKKAYDDLKGSENNSLESSIDNIQKAVESLLKKIFNKLNIAFSSSDTYMPLIQQASASGLLLPCSDDKLNTLLPCITNNLKRLGEMRNMAGGHGKIDSKVTDTIARLAINHAMADMLYIMEIYLLKSK